MRCFVCELRRATDSATLRHRGDGRFQADFVFEQSKLFEISSLLEAIYLLCNDHVIDLNAPLFVSLMPSTCNKTIDRDEAICLPVHVLLRILLRSSISGSTE